VNKSEGRPAHRADVGQAIGSGAGARSHHQFLHHSAPDYPQSIPARMLR